MIEDWFRGILTDGILSNLSGLFDSVNTEVGEIATQVGTTPAGWNAGIFNMIRSLSENVIVPIAGVIITFVMCYELIQLVIEKNNLHDLDTWIFFKWIFKTFVAVLLVTNTWNIVMGVFDITQSVVNDSAGVIISDTSIDIATVITDIEAKLDAMSVGGLLGLWFQSLFVGLTMKALSICIMLVVYGRMIGNIPRVQKRRFSSKGGVRAFWEPGFSKPVKKSIKDVKSVTLASSDLPRRETTRGTIAYRKNRKLGKPSTHD